MTKREKLIFKLAEKRRVYIEPEKQEHKPKVITTTTTKHIETTKKAIL